MLSLLRKIFSPKPIATISVTYEKPTPSADRGTYIPPKDPIPPYACPYCGVLLSECPKRKKKCPACKKPIHIKYLPNDSEKQKRLVTEQKADEIEEMWNLRELLVDFPQQFDIPADNIKSLVDSMTSQRRSFRDIRWGVCNYIVTKLIERSDYQSLRSIYHRMALFLDEEGRDPMSLLEQSAKMELLDLKRNDNFVKSISVLSTGGCPSCVALSGKTFTIEQALKEMPLPVKTCSRPLNKSSKHPFCRCCYKAELA